MRTVIGMATRVLIGCSISLGLLHLALQADWIGSAERLMASHSTGDPREAFARAERLLELNQTEAGITAFEAIVNRSPKFAPAHRRLGTLAWEQGDPLKAIWHLNAALRLGGLDSDGHTALVRALLALGEPERALREIASRPERNVAVPLLVLRGDALRQLEQHAQAAAAYQRALSLGGENPAARTGLAALALDTADLARARQHISAVLESSPEFAPAWRVKGDLAMLADSPAEAVEAYSEALFNGENSPHLHWAMVRAKIGAGQLHSVQEHLVAVRRIYPEHPETFYLECEADLRGNDLESARLACLEALRLQPEHLPSKRLLGEILYRLGEFESALQYLRKYVDLVPESHEAKRLVAQIYLIKGDVLHAVDVLASEMDLEDADPESLMVLANALLEAGDHDKALVYLRAAARRIEADPVRTAGLRKVAHAGVSAVGAITPSGLASPEQSEVVRVLTLLRDGEYDRAVEDALVLTKQQPDSAVYQNVLGVVYLEKPDLEAARDAFAKALVINPELVSAMLNLAAVQIRQGAVEKAVALYSQALSVEPGNRHAGLALASLAPGPVEAIAILEKIIDENPRDLPVTLRLGRLYLAANQTVEALEQVRRATALAPDRPDVRLLRGQVMMAVGEYRAAIAAYSPLVAQQPESADLQSALAEARLRSGDFAGAEQGFEKALELTEGTHASAVLGVGKVALAKQLYDKAEVYATRFSELYPELPLGLMLEGDIHLAGGKPELAIASYEKAATLGSSEELTLRLFSAQRAAGQERDAIATLKAWLESRPDSVNVLMLLADTYYAIGQLRPAEETYQQVLATAPSNGRALNNLANLYLDLEDERALEIARRAHSLLPGNAEVLDTLGWVLTKTGAAEEGLEYALKAIALAPDRADFQYHLGVAAKSAGKPEMARTALETALRSKLDFTDRGAAEELMRSL